MRLTVERDGRSTVVEVADDLASVQVDGHRYPLRVLSRGPVRAELEICGETVVVDGWPEHLAAPPGPVDVNGERAPAAVRLDRASGGRAALPLTPGRGGGSAGPAPSAGPPGTVAIVPPMPGRVVEIRVRAGERVTRGAVLLVVEAMKMRNEIASPTDGVVLEVRVQEGANVRAREPMLLLRGDGERPS